MQYSQKKLFEAVKDILDPELGIPILDLGLIYEIKQTKKDKIEVLMTLTSMGCPLFELMENPIKENLGKLKGINTVEVNLTFDPPWHTDMMTEKAKIKLGFF